MSSITTTVEGPGRATRSRTHHDPNLQHHFATKEQQFDTVKIGMWLFLATEILMFGGLFAGFAYMQSRFPEAFFEGAQASRQAAAWRLEYRRAADQQFHDGDGRSQGRHEQAEAADQLS